MHYKHTKYFTINSTQYLYKDKEPYILPQYCNAIVFILDVEDEKIWFVINCKPRGKHIMHLIDEDDNDI